MNEYACETLRSQDELEKNMLKKVYNNLRERKCLLSGSAVFSHLKDEDHRALKNLDRHGYITFRQDNPSNHYSTDVRVQTHVWITPQGQDKALVLIDE